MPFLHYSSCYRGFHARDDVTEGVKLLALHHLKRGANHISAHILLSERTVDFLSSVECYYNRHPDLHGYTGLHCIAYMGIAEIANAMVDMKVWDLNQRDSKGQCSQRSGGPGGPTGKLPRRLGRTGRQFSLRPVLGHFRTAGLSEDHGPDKVRHYYAILIQGR